jgi:hypothetical protein
MELSEDKRLLWCGEFPDAVIKLCVRVGGRRREQL